MVPLVQQHSTEETNRYILGNRNPRQKYSINLGRFHALDGSLGASLYLDISKPHVTLIAGKRGYGKSYTMGVFLEEFSRLPKKSKNKFSTIVIDTLGIFWTLAYPNTKQDMLLSDWNEKPEKTPISLLHTAKKRPRVYKEIPHVYQLLIPPQLLSVSQWCHLFNISQIEPEGILLSKTILSLKAQKKSFSLKDMKNKLQTIPVVKEETIQVVENFIQQAESWNVFSSTSNLFSSLIKPGEITVVDLSYLKSTHVKQVITGIIAELLFYFRIQQRKIEEYNQITTPNKEKSSPYIWLAIDEAHLFLPSYHSSYVKTVLLENWLRQGRQPGLSVMLATQRPSFMDSEVLSHSDIVLCHRLTAEEDVQSLTRLRPTYMKGDIEETIKQIGTEKGVALIIDDVVETTHILRIRPRYSWHGGGEPQPIKEGRGD
jgi:hypothetical protein